MSKFSKLFAGAMVLTAFALSAGAAQATPVLEYSTNGGSTWTDLSLTPVGSDYVNFETLSNGWTSFFTIGSNSPGTASLADILDAQLDLTNNSRSVETVWFLVGDTGFSAPTAPPVLLLNNHLGGSVTVGSASNTISQISCIDPNNGSLSCIGTDNTPPVTPSIVSAAQSFSGDSYLSFNALSSPYSMTELIEVTLGPGADVGWRSTSTLDVVPEPPTLALLGAALLGLGFLRFRKRRMA